MYLLGLGILLTLLKYFEYGPVAHWEWWQVLLPYAGAVIWWSWADWSGYTKRKAMEREDQRRLDRINRQREAIGQKPRSSAPPPRRR
ncbi:MAG: TIGR04438 family Trp-rich protein [Comamonadaceae bacterium]|nr:TIGR04438 family Trp-rich protein [Comamonadaceae bacterium]RRD57305.1 TIGR04438 family Trp-rich protein [Comamonadaceae bacterium OH2545_COT-014]